MTRFKNLKIYHDFMEENNLWKEKFELVKSKTSFEIANFLVDKYHIKTIGEKRNREIYIYQNGIYTSGVNTLKGEIQQMLEELATTQVKNEIVEKIKDLTVSNRRDFYVSRDLINLNNGVLDIKKVELNQHDPKYLFLHKIPIDYVPGMNCPVIKKFFSEVLSEDNIAVIQEWFGYVLYRSYFIKKAIIFVGERDTGKTTLMSLFERLVGKENISGVSLQRLATDKFAAAHLYDKHINIYDDLSFKDINDNGAFKIATGGGLITGEYKFGDQFQFESYSKLTFSCNKIPSVKDTNDEAYFSRWIVIPFNKAVAKPDKFLIYKLSAPEELSGLLNFAIEGLKRILGNQSFSYKKDPEEIKTEMLRSGSVIANFAYDCLEQGNGSWLSKEEMYNAFIAYANSKELPAGTIENFGKKITIYATYINHGKQLDNSTNKQITGWRGVRLKDNNSTQDLENIIDSIGI